MIGSTWGMRHSSMKNFPNKETNLIAKYDLDNSSMILHKI